MIYFVEMVYGLILDYVVFIDFVVVVVCCEIDIDFCGSEIVVIIVLCSSFQLFVIFRLRCSRYSIRLLFMVSQNEVRLCIIIIVKWKNILIVKK